MRNSDSPNLVLISLVVCGCILFLVLLNVFSDPPALNALGVVESNKIDTTVQGIGSGSYKVDNTMPAAYVDLGSNSSFRVRSVDKNSAGTFSMYVQVEGDTRPSIDAIAIMTRELLPIIVETDHVSTGFIYYITDARLVDDTFDIASTYFDIDQNKMRIERVSDELYGKYNRFKEETDTMLENGKLNIEGNSFDVEDRPIYREED